MKNSVKKISKLFLLVTMLAGLSSCDFSKGGPTNIGQNPIVDDTLPSDDPTSEINIVFWECLGGAKEGNLGIIADKFNQQYAGKYHIDLKKIAGDYDSLHDTVKTRLSSGEVPALCMGYPDSFSEYISNYIDESSILRLDNFINDETYGYSETELKDFVSAYYNEGNHYQFEGTWSMPMYKSTEVMYYNYNYFAGDNPQTNKKLANDSQYQELKKKVSAGGATASVADLDALKEYTASKGGYTYNVPKTWDEMIQVASKMKQDMQTESINSEFYPIGYDSDANLLITQFAQRGIDYTTNDEASQEDPSKHFTFNNSSAKEFVTDLIEDLIESKLMITKGTLGGDKYTNTYFNDGRLAMSIGSTGGSSYQVSANFRVGLAPVPYSGTTPKYIQQGPSICFFNNFDSYVHKGAWLFYKMLAEPENNASLALENSYDPIRVSSYETDQYESWIANAGKGTLAYDIPQITSTLKNYYMTSEVFVGSSTARTEIGKIIQNIYSSNMSVDDAFLAAYNTCVRAVED